MRRNFTVHNESRGIYATDLFTNAAIETIQKHNKAEPLFLYLSHLAPHSGNNYELLQAPQDEIEKFAYITNVNRRIYAAMVSKLDESIGRVIKTLHTENLLKNSIVLFLSDNGASVQGFNQNYGSNYPFRGVSFFCVCYR